MYKAVVGFAVGMFMCGVVSGVSASNYGLSYYGHHGQPSSDYVWVDYCPYEDVSYLAKKEDCDEVDTFNHVNGYWEEVNW